DGPIAAAESRHREGVGKTHQRADQAGQRHQLEEFGRRVAEARLREVGGNDAPDLPDRKTDMFGDDRIDEVAAGNRLALAFPERRVFRVPIGNPCLTARHRAYSLGNIGPPLVHDQAAADRPAFGTIRDLPAANAVPTTRADISVRARPSRSPGAT